MRPNIQSSVPWNTLASLVDLVPATLKNVDMNGCPALQRRNVLSLDPRYIPSKLWPLCSHLVNQQEQEVVGE